MWIVAGFELRPPNKGIRFESCYTILMSYIHVFTDGVDKLLSASIWFTWWGGSDSFCFYQNNSLKGYIDKNEFDKLIERYGEESTNKAIEILDQYVMSKGKKYNSHYHTILGWPVQQAMYKGNVTSSRPQPQESATNCPKNNFFPRPV